MLQGRADDDLELAPLRWMAGSHHDPSLHLGAFAELANANVGLLASGRTGSAGRIDRTAGVRMRPARAEAAGWSGMVPCRSGHAWDSGGLLPGTLSRLSMWPGGIG